MQPDTNPKPQFRKSLLITCILAGPPIGSAIICTAIGLMSVFEALGQNDLRGIGWGLASIPFLFVLSIPYAYFLGIVPALVSGTLIASFAADGRSVNIVECAAWASPFAMLSTIFLFALNVELTYAAAFGGIQIVSALIVRMILPAPFKERTNKASR